MRRLAVKLAILLAAAVITAVGALGAYGYGRDYYLHRGFAALVQLRRAGTGRLLAVGFYSPALHRRADYMVYLPPGYSPRRRYPVYYLLHGMPGQPKVFVDIANMDVRLDNQLALGRARPMILVYPDGRIGGSVFSDSEWANTPSGNFESYVVDVMHNVDQRFSTLAHRQDRVIAGFSAGAYGAINVALHHLGDFGNVQTWSGYFTQTRSGVFATAGARMLAYNSPVDYVSRLGHGLALPLRVYMYVGRGDSASRQQQPMIGALRAAGAQVQYRSYAGGHDWSVWYPRLNQMLDLASRDTALPLVARHRPGLSQPARAWPPGRAPPAFAAGVSRPAALGLGQHHRHTASELRLLNALLLALISAALINLGFVLQQRGHSHALAVGRGRLIDGFRDRSWLTGQAVGWLGFAGQIVAVALAPLTLVQAFCAGSLALSVPLAARLVGQSIRREQLIAIGVIAVSLVTLPIGFAGSHGHLQPGILIAAAMVALLGGAVLAPVAGRAAQAIAAGALYGAADAAIKADAVALRVHGIGGLLSGWTVLAGLCTFGGFLCFQAALRDADAVRPLSLMNALTAVTAAALGVAAFGEPLGTTPLASVVHVAAIALVLACVRPLARAQQRLVHPVAVPGSAEGAAQASGSPAWMGFPAARTLRGFPVRAFRLAAVAVLGALALVLCCAIGLGLLYTARGLHGLAIGPSVPDALPLLQLAGFAGQPLLATLVTGLAAGGLLGVVLTRVARLRRVIFVAILAPLLMVVLSDASYAVARNVSLNLVLLYRAPGLGPWLEGLLLAAGCVIAPHSRSGRLSGATAWLRDQAPASLLRQARGGPAVAGRRLILVPLLAGGLAAALLAALVLPSGHARAQPRPARPLTTVAEFPPPLPASRPAEADRTSTRAASATAPVAGHLLTVRFYSEALRRPADYLVYLPSDYTGAQRLPVFYMLHGMPGRPMAFTVNAGIETKLETLIQRQAVQPMILVFPDGRIRGLTQTDSEWANTRAGRFDSYVVDVVHNVDQRFATLPYRHDRAIAGLSAGAYGAANIALHHLPVFGLLQVWSGYFRQTRTGVFAHATRARLAFNSPSEYVRTIARQLARYPLRAFLYIGRGDGDRRQTAPMTSALRAAGANAHYAIYPGGHSWSLWAPRVDQMLIMASHYFGRSHA